MLDEETENKPINYVYILCFVLMFAPVPLYSIGSDVWTRYALEKISSYAVGIVTGIAIIEGFGDILSQMESKFSINKKASSLVTIISFALFVSIEVLVMPGAWFNTGIGFASDISSAKIIKTAISFIIIGGAWLFAMYQLAKKGKNIASDLPNNERISQ